MNAIFLDCLGWTHSKSVSSHAVTEYSDPPEADKWLGPRVHSALYG